VRCPVSGCWPSCSP